MASIVYPDGSILRPSAVGSLMGYRQGLQLQPFEARWEWISLSLRQFGKRCCLLSVRSHRTQARRNASSGEEKYRAARAVLLEMGR